MASFDEKSAKNVPHGIFWGLGLHPLEAVSELMDETLEALSNGEIG